ncbi:MAG: hypothetical protein R3221_04915 [Spongiibacter sp.]|nr:hypothetical protein [Spongiibacter sp.]
MNKNVLLALAVSSVLAACGSSSSGGGGGSRAPAEGVQGGASKGVIAGGVVNAYAISESGEVDRTVKLATQTTTGEDGSYSLVLNSNYTGGVVYVEVTSAATGTTMRCDLLVCQRDSNGDAIVSFGESYELASDFTMAAVIPNASGQISASVTPLTHIAAQFTLDKVAKGGRVFDAASAANAQVANKFKLTGNLIDQPIVDITSSTSLNTATKDALEYNVKAAAVVAAALGSSNDITLEQALEGFVSQYVDSGVAEHEDTPADTLSLEEIFDAAQGLLGEVDDVAGVTNTAVTQVSNEVNAEKSSLAGGSTVADRGDAPDDIGSEGLQATKAFVKQLRNFGTAANLSSAQLSAGQGFHAQIGMAADMMSDDASATLDALGQGVNAIASAHAAYREAQLNEETPPASHTEGDIEVTITATATGVEYSIDQTLTIVVNDELDIGVDLVLTAVDDSAVEQTETTAEGETTVDHEGPVDLSISGSSSTAVAVLSIADTSAVTATLDVQTRSSETTTGGSPLPGVGEESTVGETHATVVVTDLSAALAVSLNQLASDEVTDPVGFDGELAMSVDRIDGSHDRYYREDSSINGTTSGEEADSALLIDNIALTLSGRLYNTSGDQLRASISATLEKFDASCSGNSSKTTSVTGQTTGEGGYDHETGFTSEGSAEQCTVVNEEADFADASLTLIFAAQLDGIADVVKVTANGTRSGFEEVTINLELVYNGSSLTVAHVADLSDDAAGRSVTITNHNNVMLTLNDPADPEQGINGKIEQGGEKYADIDEDAGIVVITYSDGTFESAFSGSSSGAGSSGS